MPNKKNPKNGFYFFMKDLQGEIQQTQGRTIPMKDLPSIAHPKWKELSEEEREVYNEKAKQWKQHQRTTLEGKLDCTGAPIARALQAKKEGEDKQNSIVRAIRGHLKQLGTMDGVVKEKFYIISINIFCETEEGIYVPAEVGLVEYSILEGITNRLHHFVDPGDLPVGYTFLCKQMSDDVHKIPIQNFNLASKNYMYIWNQIKLFLNPTKQAGYYPPMYAFPEEMEQVEGSLSWLHRKSGDYLENPFDVSNLAILLLELRMFASEQGASSFVNSAGLAADILTRNVFDYVQSISCQWHEEQDVSNYCSLGIVKRYAYLMSDYLCEVYDVEMLPEKHVPLCEDSDLISVRDPGTIKLDVKPIQNKLDAPYKSSKHQFSEHLVTNWKSKYDTSQDTIVIPGASAGVRSEIPANESANVPTVPSAPWSAANIVKGAASDFRLLEDDFPSLSFGPSSPRQSLPSTGYAAVASAIGRGGRSRGRGIRIPGAHQEVPNIPTQMQYVGIGRALTLGDRNVQLGSATVTKP